MRVSRSRFDGNYGDIARLVPVGNDGKENGAATYAPTALVFEALLTTNIAAAFSELYSAWIPASN